MGRDVFGLAMRKKRTVFPHSGTLTSKQILQILVLQIYTKTIVDLSWQTYHSLHAKLSCNKVDKSLNKGRNPAIRSISGFAIFQQT